MGELRGDQPAPGRRGSLPAPVRSGSVAVVTAVICADCGQQVHYLSCQQPDTEFVAALALLVHQLDAHPPTRAQPPEAGEPGPPVEPEACTRYEETTQ